MKPYTSTETINRAVLYREAARMNEMAEIGDSQKFCCNAIFYCATKGMGNWGDRDNHPEVLAFHALYRPSEVLQEEPYFEEHWDARVLALCFMAAMVEAGDA